MSADSIVAIEAALSRHLASKGASVGAFEALPDGHAGLAFSVRVVGPDAREAAYVLKVAPLGIPRSGSTDVLRQVRLLNALADAGFPAPRVDLAVDDPESGVAFIGMERLPGRTFIVWRPHPVFLAQRGALPGLWRQAAEHLAALHRLSWAPLLAGWQAPTALGRELDRWGRLLRHTQDEVVLNRASALLHELVRSRPDDGPIGVVHGDFQPGNILYAQGQLTGVVDWDLAAIAPQGLDVGWLSMMADREAWPASWRPVAPLPPEELLAAYQAAGGPAGEDVLWQRAFAHFRMVAITGLNLKLHRSGRRVDEIWEHFARSAQPLLDRAAELLKARETK